MSMNQFRRFTYLISGKHNTVLELSVTIKSEDVQKQLKAAGILSFEIYHKAPNHFVLIDAEQSMDSTDISRMLSNMSEDLEQASPLERIYKFEQKAVYSAKDGQLKMAIGAKKRFVWTLLLQEDEALIEEYKRVHSIGQAWPEITANMKTVGVKDMEIYLFGTQAILIMDTKPDFNLEDVGPKWQKLPREEEWQAYVAKFQRIDPKSSIQEKWQDMIEL
ncbi:hypothetical protein MHTCC0001_00630 [Flavobacteriaceae bacterium MHTCC 0001]